MGSTIWFNVVIVDCTQINLVIQVIISQGTITMHCMLSHCTRFSFCIDKLILYSF